METRDFKPVDRTGWPPGPWDDEPDRIEWIDRATGQPCLMKRNGAGAWCGYTAVNPGHRLHGVDYMDVDGGVEAHGGLTYSGLCHGEICHVPQPGEPDDVWWFGFDANHHFDIAPRLLDGPWEALTRLTDTFVNPSGPEPAYRDENYVREQVTHLARQLADVS